MIKVYDFEFPFLIGRIRTKEEEKNDKGI